MMSTFNFLIWYVYCVHVKCHVLENTMKYLGMKRHDIYNLHSNDSEKNTEECIYTHMERERE